VKQEETPRRIGLARALSKLGYCSRTQAGNLIRAGRVRLNGSLRRDPETPVRLDRDRIAVDGQAIKRNEKIYVMMNKPRGLVTTASDEKGRNTVYSLLNQGSAGAEGDSRSQGILPWIAPVGRLDKASEGLLLLTNDSEWGARVAAPETHLEKTYHVQIGIVAGENLVQSLMRGVKSEEGDTLRARQVRILRAGQKNCWLEIILDEGKNRHIRRMLAALGVEVLRLVRIKIGPLQLGNLVKGAFRPLTKDEKQILDREMKGKEPVHPGRGAAKECSPQPALSLPKGRKPWVTK
jgi:23S rRNA pseudouridine2605 synthase